MTEPPKQAVFLCLKSGQLFYLDEPDGTLVGKYIANSDAYININGVWQIDCTAPHHLINLEGII